MFSSASLFYGLVGWLLLSINPITIILLSSLNNDAYSYVSKVLVSMYFVGVTETLLVLTFLNWKVTVATLSLILNVSERYLKLNYPAQNTVYNQYKQTVTNYYNYYTINYDYRGVTNNVWINHFGEIVNKIYSDISVVVQSKINMIVREPYFTNQDFKQIDELVGTFIFENCTVINNCKKTE